MAPMALGEFASILKHVRPERLGPCDTQCGEDERLLLALLSGVCVPYWTCLEVPAFSAM